MASTQIHWYRFGQKKGSYLSRDISYTYMFREDYLHAIPEFGFSIQHYKYIDWKHFMDREEIFATFQALLAKVLKVKTLDHFYDFATRCDNEIRSFTGGLNAKIAATPSNEELAQLFEQWIRVKAYADLNVMCGNYLVRTLSQEVERVARIHFSSLGEDETKQRLLVLSYSDRETAFYRRERELLECAAQLAHDDVSARSLRSLPVEQARHVQELHGRYAWMNVMFLIHRPTSVDDVWNELIELSKNDPKKKLEELRAIRAQEIAKRDGMLSAMHADTEFRSVLHLLQESSWVEAEVVRFFQSSSAIALPFLQLIAARFGLEYDDLIALSIAEVVSALRGQSLPERGIIESRKEAFGVFVDLPNGIFRFLEKDEMAPYREKDDRVASDVVRGMPASSGTARGKVRVILDVSELPSFERGDILVTTMTTPSFVIAMKKAAAIVTNDGGITCHAAIVARELGVPCVIATKNATEILKTGDLVDVDATKGIVTKL